MCTHIFKETILNEQFEKGGLKINDLELRLKNFMISNGREAIGSTVKILTKSIA
jgi:hypothetical protein